MPIPFYGFQLAPDVRFVTPETGWRGWFENHAYPLIQRGHRDHHLHNPFGLYDLHDRNSHIDQFELAYCRGLTWLANREGFTQAVEMVHKHGGTVRAYVGSPLRIPEIPPLESLPRCMPGAWWISVQLQLARGLGACDGWSFPTPFGSIRLLPECLCWQGLIRFYISVLVDARVDVIGFDASPDFHPGDCMDRLVRQLIGGGIEVMIESWPLSGRTYPPVSWIVREQRYQRIRFDPRDDIPVEMVQGKIYRIVPAHDSERGIEEINFINTIRIRHGQSPYPYNSRQIADIVTSDGHIPLVRSRLL
jgi:hypothetical protein